MAHGVWPRLLLREKRKATRPSLFWTLLGGFGKRTIEVRSQCRICVDVQSHGCIVESLAVFRVVAFYFSMWGWDFTILGQL